MRRLLPEPADDISVDDAYSFALGDRPGRPWVGLCMVASIDGSTVVGGNSAGLSSDTDTAVLGRLRRLADVIVVGAGTVRDEGYGAPRKPGQRVGVITRSGKVDVTSELFTSGAGFLVTSEQSVVDAPGIDIIRAGTGQRRPARRHRAHCRADSIVPVRPGRGRGSAQRCPPRRGRPRRDQPDDVTGDRRRRWPSPGDRRHTTSASIRAPPTRHRRAVVHVQPLATSAWLTSRAAPAPGGSPPPHRSPCRRWRTGDTRLRRLLAVGRARPGRPQRS